VVVDGEIYRGRAGVDGTRSCHLIARDGTVLDSLTLHTRRTIRWALDGSALLAFLPVPARDDEFVRIDVDQSGRVARVPTAVMPGVPTLYRGEFDIAARTGRLLFISGETRPDQWVFGVGGGNDTPRPATTGRLQTAVARAMRS